MECDGECGRESDGLMGFYGECWSIYCSRVRQNKCRKCGDEFAYDARAL